MAIDIDDHTIGQPFAGFKGASTTSVNLLRYHFNHYYLRLTSTEWSIVDCGINTSSNARLRHSRCFKGALRLVGAWQGDKLNLMFIWSEDGGDCKSIEGLFFEPVAETERRTSDNSLCPNQRPSDRSSCDSFQSTLFQRPPNIFCPRFLILFLIFYLNSTTYLS